MLSSFPGTPRCCLCRSGWPQTRRDKKLLSKEQSDNDEVTPNHSSAATNLSQMKSQAGVDECFQKRSCLLAFTLQAYKPNIILRSTHIPATGLCPRPQELDVAFLPTKVPFCKGPLRPWGAVLSLARLGCLVCVSHRGIVLSHVPSSAKKATLGSLQQSHDLTQDLLASFSHHRAYFKHEADQKCSPLFSKRESILSRDEKPNPQKLQWGLMKPAEN